MRPARSLLIRSRTRPVLVCALLAAACTAGTPHGGAPRVAEAVRVYGAIAGAAPGAKVTVRIGWGAREAATARHYRTLGLQPPAAAPNGPDGVALPPSPSRWQTARVAGNRFDTRGVGAGGDVQVVAFDDDGRSAVVDVPLPAALATGSTIDAGTIELRPRAALDVAVTLPAADVPIAISVGVAGAEPAADDDDLGRYLSALDQIDPRLFRLFVLGGGWALGYDGSGRLGALPPISSVELVLQELHGGGGLRRRLSLAPGGTASLLVGFDEIDGSRAPETGTLAGRVVLEVQRQPVAGATVVVSDFPRRLETVTDAEGRFHVDGVRGDRPLVVFVDASRARRTGHAASHVFRWVDPSLVGDLALPARIAVPDRSLPRAGTASNGSAGAPRRLQVGTDLDAPEPVSPAATPTPAPPPPPGSPVAGSTTPFPEPQDTSLFLPCDTPDPQYGGATSFVVLTAGANPAPYLWWQASTDGVSKAAVSACDAGAYTIYYAGSPFYVLSGSLSLVNGPQSVGCPPACPGACYFNDPPAVTMAPSPPRIPNLNFTFVNAGQPLPSLSVWFSPPDPFLDYDATPQTTNDDGVLYLCNVVPTQLPIYIQQPDGSSFECTLNAVTSIVDISLPIVDGQCPQ